LSPRALLPVAALAFCGCGDQVLANQGLNGLIQVSGAQFWPGLPPSPSDAGLPVVGITLNTSAFFPGQINFAYAGQLAPGAVAVSLYYQGDIGYWTVPATGLDPSIPGSVDFSTSLNFSRAIANIHYGDGGPAVVMQAIDSDGGFGPTLTEPLELLSSTPKAKLVITLAWDLEADLDLHVVFPDGGVEIWRQHRSNYVPSELGPAPPKLQTFIEAHNAYLDFDSNAQCVIDGRRVENVIWGPDAGIAPGTYTVRVDAFSMCGLPYAAWQVGAFVDGGQIAGATGQSLPSDEAYFQHGAGAGVTAFTFTVQ